MNAHPHSHSEHSAPEKATSCCVYEVALEALTVPIAVHDHDLLLYLNAEVRQLLGFKSRTEVGGYPISKLVTPGLSEAFAERRRLVLEAEVSMRNVPIKLTTRDGYGLSIVTDTEPTRFGHGEQAIVQLFRSINGIDTLSFSAPVLPPQKRPEASEAGCVHAAAFEALPMPAAIMDRERVISANRQSRLVVGDDGSEGDLALEKVLHEDFLDTGEQLFRLALHDLHATRCCRAKLTSGEGRTLYATVDALPVESAGERYVAVFAFEVDPVA